MRLKIASWDKYQHYKDRNPPWIKLHRDTLSSRMWVSLSDASRVLAVACMLIAARDDAGDGSFEADPDYFTRVAYLNGKPDFNPLIKIGFLETLADASNLLASACLYKEGEAKPKKKSTKDVWGWTGPNAEHMALAEQLGLNVLTEAEKMRDWALSKNERKADWDAAFRNWLRNAKPTQAPVRGKIPDTDYERERWMNALIQYGQTQGRVWPANLGPKPGSKDCRVPTKFLVEYHNTKGSVDLTRFHSRP